MAILLVVTMFAGFMTVQYLREQRQNKSPQATMAHRPTMQQAVLSK